MPLVRKGPSRNTIIVHINLTMRPEPPRTAREIQDRLNEIAFNSVLIKELRAAAMMRRAADPGTGEGRALAEMRLTRIASDIKRTLGDSSNLLAEWDSFTMPWDEGCWRRTRPCPAWARSWGAPDPGHIDTYLDEL